VPAPGRSPLGHRAGGGPRDRAESCGAQRLERRFHVLSGGRRGAVERHATLRAAIDWSFDLLSGAEQRLLARIAVFSGGCTLGAIEEICSGDPVESEDVPDLVTSLVARSLVVAEDRGLGTRYRLLETIRQYAEERLAETDETDTLLMRHALFYADLSVTAGENSYGPDQIASAKQVSLERDNIRVAFTTALDVRDAALAVRLVANHPHSQSHSSHRWARCLPCRRRASSTLLKPPSSQGFRGY
jgi:predicted ATPase